MKSVFPGELNLSYGDAPYDIHIEAKAVGKDILASVTGGTRPHIGAAALAEPAGARHPVTGEPPSVTDGSRSVTGEPKSGEPKEGSPVLAANTLGQDDPSPRVALLSAFGHKDALLAEMFARGLCERYGATVCAAAGVHVDDAGPDEIALMVENAKALLALALAL